MLRPQSSTYRRWTSALAAPASRQIDAITITTTRRLMGILLGATAGSGLAPRVGAMLGRTFDRRSVHVVTPLASSTRRPSAPGHRARRRAAGGAVGGFGIHTQVYGTFTPSPRST